MVLSALVSVVVHLMAVVVPSANRAASTGVSSNAVPARYFTAVPSLSALVTVKEFCSSVTVRALPATAVKVPSGVAHCDRLPDASIFR